MQTLDLRLIAAISEWLGVIATTILLTISTRFRQIRPVTFIHKRREGITVLSLFTLIIILAIMLYTGTFRISLQQIGNGVLWLRMFVALLSILPFAAVFFSRRQPFLSVGWGKQMVGPSLQLGFALLLLTIFLSGKINRLITGGVSELAWSNLAIWCGICLAEESIFRGYIQIRLSAWMGKWQGLCATALLFIIWQIPRLWGLSGDAIALNLLLSAGQGLVLGWLMQKNGHLFAPLLYRIISEWIIMI